MATIHEITKDWQTEGLSPTWVKLQAAQAEFDALAADAARYRWLRDPENGGDLSVAKQLSVCDEYPRYEEVEWYYSKELDVAIDESMKDD